MSERRDKQMRADAEQIGDVIRLRPSQREFFNVDAYVQSMIACRQWGKDFTTACKFTRRALRRGKHIYIVSLTQRQADETFHKCQFVADVYRESIARLGRLTTEVGEPYPDVDPETGLEFRHRARTLQFPGVDGNPGGSITSLPGRNADTIAGYTGDIVLTEFALFPKGGYEHWRVVFPITTRGHQVIAITTPRGKNTKAYELVHSPPPGAWVGRCDIYQAVAEGMPLHDESGQARSLEEFKAQYGDPIGWRRDYELEWTGDLEALLKWTQLQTAAELRLDRTFVCRVNGDAGWSDSFFDLLASMPGRAEMGWDVARNGDLAALWVNVAAPGRRRFLSHLVVMHDVSFALQRHIVRRAMDTRPDNVGAGDATGLGKSDNETLASLYGDRWLPFTFTQSSKREIGSLLKVAFDDRDQALPEVDGPFRFVALDLYAIQKEGDADRHGSDTLKLIEGENPDEPNSHCDIAYACGLARKAAGIQFVSPFVSVWN